MRPVRGLNTPENGLEKPSIGIEGSKSRLKDLGVSGGQEEVSGWSEDVLRRPVDLEGFGGHRESSVGQRELGGFCRPLA